MKKIFICLVAMLSMGIAASAMSYTEDEQSIDAMIEMATEVTPASMEAEGISSFLCVGTLAAFTAECYAKKGASDWRTILFGSLASLFYIGNVYGSYLSVGIYNETLFNAQNSTILFNLHIPVRNLVER